MIFPYLRRGPDGRAIFEDLPPAIVLLLMELPELLRPEDQPDAVKQRLFPEPGVDAAHAADWKRLVHPELFALLASAREIVTRDLSALQPGEDAARGTTWRLEIPAEHVPGWISALNAARLALGARFGIEDEDDMHFPRGPVGEPDERRIAVAKIHFLGELQAQLILDRDPPPPGTRWLPEDDSLDEEDALDEDDSLEEDDSLGEDDSLDDDGAEDPDDETA